MTQLEQQMQAELMVTQSLCNYFAEYLTQQGVPSTSDEGLDTLVPKVLLISGGGDVEHDDTLNKNINSLFLHATQSQHDRWTNNYSYKIENKSVSVWVASTKYTDFAYESKIIIANLSEDDFVNVVFGVNEAVSGNYAPAIEQYAGYILVFSKVNTAITIPTISVTKIEL